MKNRERGGFVVGCQTDFLLRHLHGFESSVMVLMFDVFASYGFGADVGPDIGPTQNLRRDIVKSIKLHTKKIVVFSYEQSKNMAFLNSVDPKQYHNGNNRELLLTWMELAAGAIVPTFVNAGGHFADAISILRDGRGVITVPDAIHCRSDYEESTDGDDLLEPDQLMR